MQSFGGIEKRKKGEVKANDKVPEKVVNKKKTRYRVFENKSRNDLSIADKAASENTGL